MANPLVSILIPCYRQGHYLRQTVECALGQTYSPIEIIVINDGSDDDTETVARSFGEKIRYHWQPNRGLPATRNKAISLARGKYVLCLDSDDLLHPDAVQWLVEAANDREDVLCVMGCTLFKNDPSRDGYSTRLPPTDRSPALTLLVKNLGPPNIYLCSRSMIRSIGGFDVRLKSCEDWDAWLRLFFAGARIIPIPCVGAFYRTHPTSMSKNKVVMPTTRSTTLWRAYRWTRGHPDQIARMGGDVKQIHREMAEEFFDCGYRLRIADRYLRALLAYYRSIRAGGSHTLAWLEIVKLLPRSVVRGFSLRCPGSTQTTRLEVRT